MTESKSLSDKKETVLYSRHGEPNILDPESIQNAFSFEATDEDLKLYAPTWPYLSWDDTDKTIHGDLDGSPEADSFNNSCLSTLVKRSLEKINNFEDTVSKNILKDMENTMKGVIKTLCVKHPMFELCELKLAGSVAEGTKIGEANEFDYLLILKNFENKKAFRLDVRQSFLRIEVLHPEKNRKIFGENMTLDEQENKIFLNDVRKTLMTLFVDEFENQLPDVWVLQRDNGRFCLSSIATTLHLHCSKYNLDVDIDICLCCPVLPEDIENTLKFQGKKLQDTEHKFFKYLKQRNDQNAVTVFAIISGETGLFPNVMYTRIASLPLEMEMFSRFGKEDGRIQTYCVAKCIAESFLPKVTQIFGCNRCCHRLARSYHLKNILFFLMKHFEDDSQWASEVIGKRVLEIFNLLRLCVNKQSSDEQKVNSVSTFCTPGSLRLEDLSTWNPYIPKDRHKTERTEYLFTEDSHKPTFQLSSSPVMQECLKTENTEANDEIEKWFFHLNNEQWNTYELFGELYNLLEKLSKMESCDQTSK